MTHRLIKGGELYLYGPVGFVDSFGEGFSASDVVDALVEMLGSISVRINSGGGVAVDGIAICNSLLRHNGDVAVTVDGIAASAASIIAMAGDTIDMPVGSLMMIHEASGLTQGTAGDHLQSATALEKHNDAMAGIYAAKSGRPASEMRQLMRDETWMTGEEAVKRGLATSSGGAFANAPAAYDYRLYGHAPQRLVAMANDWAKAGRFTRLASGERALEIVQAWKNSTVLQAQYGSFAAYLQAVEGGRAVASVTTEDKSMNSLKTLQASIEAEWRSNPALEKQYVTFGAFQALKERDYCRANDIRHSDLKAAQVDVKTHIEKLRQNPRLDIDAAEIAKIHARAAEWEASAQLRGEFGNSFAGYDAYQRWSAKSGIKRIGTNLDR